MPIGENKDQILTTFHQIFSQLFEVLPVLRAHDVLTIIKNNQQIFIAELFD